MVKKIYSLVLALVLVAICVLPVSAEPDNDYRVYNPDPAKYVYVNTVVTGLSISGGIASIEVTVKDPNNNTTQIKTTATLQKKSGTSWEYEASWNKVSSTHSLILAKTKSVKRGTYRVKNVTKAYSGSASETIIQYSPTITY